MMQPSYIKAYQSGKLKTTVQKALNLLKSCVICPRKCQVNRLNGQQGFCKTGMMAKAYSFMAHHGEEPPISGNFGSGTIFFANCNMACVYCQNYEFSQGLAKAKELPAHELAQIMLELQKNGCHNINFVSPTHIMPQILQALEIAIGEGLNIPLVYNTGGYELAEVIKLLDGIIDVYLVDMRYANQEYSLKYSNAMDYPRYNQQAVIEMRRQVGIAVFDEDGIIQKGLVVRHLVLPDGISGTESIMKFIANKISKDTYISLMSQYMPCYKTKDFLELDRRINMKEYEKAQKVLEKYGLYNGWIQEAYGLDRLAGTNIKPSFNNE